MDGVGITPNRSPVWDPALPHPAWGTCMRCVRTVRISRPWRGQCRRRCANTAEQVQASLTARKTKAERSSFNRRHRRGLAALAQKMKLAKEAQKVCSCWEPPVRNQPAVSDNVSDILTTDPHTHRSHSQQGPDRQSTFQCRVPAADVEPGADSETKSACVQKSAAAQTARIAAVKKAGAERAQAVLDPDGQEPLPGCEAERAQHAAAVEASSRADAAVERPFDQVPDALVSLQPILTTKGYDHKTPIRTSFDQRFNRYSQLSLPLQPRDLIRNKQLQVPDNTRSQHSLAIASGCR